MEKEYGVKGEKEENKTSVCLSVCLSAVCLAAFASPVVTRLVMFALARSHLDRLLF